jgi:hypothetical protein
VERLARQAAEIPALERGSYQPRWLRVWAAAALASALALSMWLIPSSVNPPARGGKVQRSAVSDVLEREAEVEAEDPEELTALLEPLHTPAGGDNERVWLRVYDNLLATRQGSN